MERNRIDMDEWILRATHGIKFIPDRTAVANELREHFEDKLLDLQRLYPDMTPEAAVQRALNQMGDPEEVGRELAKIHRPWLGYLWRVSQVIVCLALIFGILGILENGVLDVGYRLYYAAEEWVEYVQDSGKLFGDRIPAGEKRSAYYRPNAEARLGECTITVPRAVRYQPEGEGEALYLEMFLDYDKPWHRNDVTFYFMWAEDDLGNRYNEQGCKFEAKKLSGLTKAYCCMILDVPEEAKWIEFHHEYRPGLDLRVDLTREVRG